MKIQMLQFMNLKDAWTHYNFQFQMKVSVSAHAKNIIGKFQFKMGVHFHSQSFSIIQSIPWLLLLINTNDCQNWFTGIIRGLLWEFASSLEIPFNILCDNNQMKNRVKGVFIWCGLICILLYFSKSGMCTPSV